MMEENSRDSEGSIILPNENIRLVETNLHSLLEVFLKKVPDESFTETCYICDSVREKVLNSEDEPHLSKIQNHCRRISIASELFIGICSMYEYFVDYEFSKIIDDLMQWKKYKNLTSKITQRMSLELEKEKYYRQEAHSKLEQVLNDEASALEAARTEIARDIEVPAEIEVPQPCDVIPGEELVELQKPDEQEKLNAPERLEDQERELRAEGLNTETLVDETRRQSQEYTAEENISHVPGNLTELRGDSVIDTSVISHPISHAQREVLSFPSAVPEIQIQETNLQAHTEDDINEILKILEEEILEKKIDEIEKPDTESTNHRKTLCDEGIRDKIPVQNEENLNQLESFEEWELPALEPARKPHKKQQGLIIDKTTTIHNYSRRALYLNDKINIQRVQVFEGPPEILDAMSVNYLMESPSFKSSLFKDTRSSKLSKLFQRHLKVEKRPTEPVIAPLRRIQEQHKEIDITNIRVTEGSEEVGMRFGMTSEPRKPDFLAETREKRSVEDLALPEKETLIGMPMSRIVSSVIEPPDLAAINNDSILPTPRVQQLQGKSLDSDSHPSWFLATRQNPPSAKYKMFDYIYKKLQEYWSLSELQGMQKSITLKEFFRFEADGGVSNFLTVLRIIDKLSIQRKLILEHKNQDILICPFEIPFVSEKQLLIKNKEPIL